MIDIHDSNALTLRGLSTWRPTQATDPSEVSRLLVDWQSGDKHALDQLMPLVYRVLRKVAADYVRDERPDNTLQPTALIHESYVRMVGQNLPQSQSWAHFFGVAAKVIRQILVDHARRRRASTLSGTHRSLSMEEASATRKSNDEQLLMLDGAMTKLASFDERKSRVVEMRVFGGMTLSDIAVALDESESTIKRDMRLARAWLRVELVR